MVLSQRLTLLTLQFELCMRTNEIATCLYFRNLTVVSSFECQNDTLFSLSLYSIFLSISPEKIKLPSKYQGVSKFSFFFFPNTLQIVNHFILAVEFFDENVSSVKRDLVLHEKWRSGKDDAKKREKLIFWELKFFWRGWCKKKIFLIPQLLIYSSRRPWVVCVTNLSVMKNSGWCWKLWQLIVLTGILKWVV